MLENVNTPFDCSNNKNDSLKFKQAHDFARKITKSPTTCKTVSQVNLLTTLAARSPIQESRWGLASLIAARKRPRRWSQLRPVLAALEVVVENDCGSNGIDYILVAAIHFFHPAVDHRAMGNRRGETLVIHLHGHTGNLPLQPRKKRVEVTGALAWLPVQLLWLPDDNQVNRLLCHILFQEIDNLRRRNCGKPVGNNLEHIGNCYPRALAPKIY